VRVLISGSLRQDSYDRRLLGAAGELLPAGVRLELWEELRDGPGKRRAPAGRARRGRRRAPGQARVQLVGSGPAEERAFGAVWAQAELRKVLARMGARAVEGDVAVGHAHERFDPGGQLLDEDLRGQLAEPLGQLVSDVPTLSAV